MKRNNFIPVFIALLVSANIMAQQKDSLPAKPVIEKGTKGDIIVGKKIKQKHLTDRPELLQKTDTVLKPGAKKKKQRHKNCSSN